MQRLSAPGEDVVAPAAAAARVPPGGRGQAPQQLQPESQQAHRQQGQQAQQQQERQQERQQQGQERQQQQQQLQQERQQGQQQQPAKASELTIGPQPARGGFVI
jgi:hypothetical protein